MCHPQVSTFFSLWLIRFAAWGGMFVPGKLGNLLGTQKGDKNF